MATCQFFWVGVSSSSSYWLNSRVDVLEPALSQHGQDTIHLGWYEAQSCQERYRSALQSTSVPDWIFIREESWLHYRSIVKHEGPYITKLCQSCYYQLRQIRTVRHSLTSSAIQTLVHAFICTRVDFSNSLLYGTSAYLLDRLQSVLNSAARLILRIGKYDQISAAIRRDLHWLPVPLHIRYKLNSITSNCPAGRAPEYTDRAMPLREWHSSKAQPSVVVPGSAPGSSISEGTIREKRFLRLLTTAVELTSCRHPTSPQRASTFPEETQNSLYATVHVTPLRIDVNSVISTTTTWDKASQNFEGRTKWRILTFQRSRSGIDFLLS